MSICIDRPASNFEDVGGIWKVNHKRLNSIGDWGMIGEYTGTADITAHCGGSSKRQNAIKVFMSDKIAYWG